MEMNSYDASSITVLPVSRYLFPALSLILSPEGVFRAGEWPCRIEVYLHIEKALYILNYSNTINKKI